MDQEIIFLINMLTSTKFTESKSKFLGADIRFLGLRTLEIIDYIVVPLK